MIFLKSFCLNSHIVLGYLSHSQLFTYLNVYSAYTIYIPEMCFYVNMRWYRHTGYTTIRSLVIYVVITTQYRSDTYVRLVGTLT